MLLKLQKQPLQEDIEIIITYPEENKVVERIVSFINSIDVTIECFTEIGIKNLRISDIYYVESTEKITEVFCENNCFRTKYRLYQLLEKLSDKGFVQISKYCIMNTHKLDSVKPLLNSQMKATLTNGKQLHITRKYLNNIRPILQENK